MNFNNFTIKSQEAIQKALEYAREAGNQAIEPVHILKGVMSEGESVVKFIFAKVGAEYRWPELWDSCPERADDGISPMP